MALHFRILFSEIGHLAVFEYFDGVFGAAPETGGALHFEVGDLLLGEGRAGDDDKKQQEEMPHGVIVWAKIRVPEQKCSSFGGRGKALCVPAVLAGTQSTKKALSYTKNE